tara:strand:- start:3339 stop:3713 length:375 start_codon:yes stop_codon:yes gene_type:complete
MGNQSVECGGWEILTGVALLGPPTENDRAAYPALAVAAPPGSAAALANAFARAASAAFAAAPPCGRITGVAVASVGVFADHTLTCPSPNVANVSASGANATPRTLGEIKLEMPPPPRPGALWIS